MARRLTLIVAASALALIGLLPVVVMIFRSFMVEGAFSLGAYATLFSSGRQWILLQNSLALSLLTAVVCSLIGLPLGILLSRTNLPFRQVFAVLFTVPFLVPPYAAAVAWSNLLALVGFRQIGGLLGCVLVLVSTFVPVVMLLTMIFSRSLNPHLEEAGRIVSPMWRVLRSVTIPLILPGISLAWILVFLLTLGEFGVPNYLRYDVFSVESFVQFSAFYNFAAATAAAVPLAAITLLVLLLERVVLGNRDYQITPASGAGEQPLIDLGVARWGWVTLTGACCLVFAIGPFLALLVQSASLHTYATALELAGESLIRSFLYSAIGATLLALIGLLLGYLIQTRGLKLWRGADLLALFLFTLPGTVIGIGLVTLWNRPATNLVYGTAAIIVLGYIAKYTAITSRISSAAFALVPPSLEEAAQVAGAGWLRRFSSISVPLVRRGLFGSWLVSYIFCFRDLDISMIVYPAGHETFPVRIFTLMANGSPQLIASLCVILVVSTLLPPSIIWLALSGTLRKSDNEPH
jgi:iron(III) transport system permease protein